MLWGNIDYGTGNNKPLYANTTTTSSNSSINGTAANAMYGVVAGVTPNEMTTNASVQPHPAHAGWTSVKVGTGPITAAVVSDGGQGINAAGFLVITDGSAMALGVGANISFTIANSQNSLQSYSTNSRLNAISTLTIANGGSGYSNVQALTVRVSNAANIVQPTITLTLGGRAGRMQVETLVAMGSITGDDPKDNVFFSGI